jgi:photosystem II stability/assembly factor-like uncharacterized protein
MFNRLKFHIFDNLCESFNMKIINFFVLIFVMFLSTATAQWIPQTIETKASFRGLSVVNQNVIWASGTGGTFIRTIDGGKNWTVGKVPDAEKLDFRDIEAFDESTAYLLSIGNGETSRIYKTIDGGKTWKMQFRANNEKIFLDAFAFFDEKHGIAMGDPVEGYYYLLQTRDGGENWNPIENEKMVSAKSGEAAFAASGTCIIKQGKKNVFMVSGGKTARVFRSSSFGYAWTVSDSPIVGGEDSQGIFSIAMFDKNRGVIVGGDYAKPNEVVSNLAFTSDGGKTWKESKGFSGFRSGVAYLDKNTIIAVGSAGSDITVDGGKTWKNLDNLSYNSVESKGKNATWAVGEKGRVAKFIK